MKTLRIVTLMLVGAVTVSCHKEPLSVKPILYHESDVEVNATAAMPEGWLPMT